MKTKGQTKTVFFCSECGAEHPKWQGQCRECGSWNSLVEEKVSRKKQTLSLSKPAEQKLLSDITLDQQSGLTTGLAEFDRVLGGQLLSGMTVLLGGDPGIGKSTLMLQVAERYSQKQIPVLYVSGEESLSQIKRRAGRLHLRGDNVTLANTISLEEITGLIGTGQYNVVFIDSIQTLASGQLDSPPGTVGQVRECANQLIMQAKVAGHALFLVGHVTKEGMIAGPKVLEHMVDTVAYFEGDTAHFYRILRAMKNRFGSVAEIGLFQMNASGLEEVTNPSSFFLSDSDDAGRTGAVVTAICEGNRPLLVELQALVTRTNYGYPQRVATGIDSRRLSLLLAILEKRGEYPMSSNDVFVSVAGGLKITEPAADLPLMTALVSSLLNKPVTKGTIMAGEVGLSGEIRPVSLIDQRVNEAARLGFDRFILPKKQIAQAKNDKIEIIGTTNLQQALDIAVA